MSVLWRGVGGVVGAPTDLAEGGGVWVRCRRGEMTKRMCESNGRNGGNSPVAPELVNRSHEDAHDRPMDCVPVRRLKMMLCGVNGIRKR